MARDAKVGSQIRVETWYLAAVCGWMLCRLLLDAGVMAASIVGLVCAARAGGHPGTAAACLFAVAFWSAWTGLAASARHIHAIIAEGEATRWSRLMVACDILSAVFCAAGMALAVFWVWGA